MLLFSFPLIQFGDTPLLMASERGHKVIVELLLNSGADYSCTNEVIIIYSLSHVIFYYNTIVLITFNESLFEEIFLIVPFKYNSCFVIGNLLDRDIIVVIFFSFNTVWGHTPSYSIRKRTQGYCRVATE